MDETTNNNITAWSTTGSTSDNFTFTASTLANDTIWFPYYDESTWLPYKYEPYVPKWHITQGYKNQIKTMWD